MRSYSELEIFTADELTLLAEATKAVEGVSIGSEVRCHELARAIGWLLEDSTTRTVTTASSTTRGSGRPSMSPRRSSRRAWACPTSWTFTASARSRWCVSSTVNTLRSPTSAGRTGPASGVRNVDAGLVAKLHARAREVLYR